MAEIGKDYSPPKALRMHLESIAKNPPQPVVVSVTTIVAADIEDLVEDS